MKRFEVLYWKTKHWWHNAQLSFIEYVILGIFSLIQTYVCVTLFLSVITLFTAGIYWWWPYDIYESIRLLW